MKQLNKKQCLLMAISNSIMVIAISLWKSATVSSLSHWIVAAIFFGLAIGFSIGWWQKRSGKANNWQSGC